MFAARLVRPCLSSLRRLAGRAPAGAVVPLLAAAWSLGLPFLPAPSAAAQAITEVTAALPDAPAPWTMPGDDALPVSVGSQLTITGSGFGGLTGTAKPKVFLVDPSAPKKKYALKVLSFSDDTILAEVKKAKVAALDLTVQPKGKGLAALVAAGAIGGAAPDFAKPAAAGPGAEVTLVPLVSFGSKQGKVRVDGKGAKVLSWTPEQVVFKAPTKLFDGLFTLEVTNKVGGGVSDEGPWAFEMAGSPVDVGGFDRCSAKLDKKKYGVVADPEDFLTALSVLPIYDGGGTPPTLQLTGIVQQAVFGDSGTPQITIDVVVPLDLGNDTFPRVVVGAADGYVDVVQSAGLFGAMTTWTTAGQGDDYVVVLHSYDQNDLTQGLQLHGTFYANLVRTSGSDGKPTLVVTKGDFKTTIETGP